ncbi:hypothetical protein [Jiangella mangrovi]|uniref:Uncharacterized protein n=1 Tax=Jiangella mangrovi TaxID=1524084 RepID=A0A7W9GLH5_9ACTN|nr:hypothetical protein [Jiangella mangrovi]MBB5786077.1 hypothetical protein [Jiangella mangrovi]
MISNDAAGLARELDLVGRDLRRRRLGGADAGTVHRLAQALADAAADARGEPRRPVPRLGDHALPDQVAVTGRDLLDALAEHPAEGRPAELDAVAAVLAEVRRGARG